MLSRVDLRQAGIDPTRRKFRPMLDALQGNILKPYGRDHVVYLFVRFKAGRAAQARAWIREFGTRHLTSAYQQLTLPPRRRGIIVANLFLSARGYRALDPRLALPADARFRAGMKGSRAALHDPSPATWERGYREQVHAAILLAGPNAGGLTQRLDAIRREMRPFARVLAVERGRVWRNHRQKAIEHFGYVDGRSQPLFLRRDIVEERRKLGGVSRWDPSAPLDLVLVRDPNGAAPDAFGSYAVFRKLEQNVRGFKTLEERLASRLGLVSEEDRERAGALAVGRFEHGTPIVLHDEETRLPIRNNFDYVRDRAGTRCPFHAHVRAVNPRTRGSRAHRLARRGIPYGARRKPPSEAQTLAEMPTRGVGLLFVCFQRDIANQFEFVQRRANAGRGGVGDPIVGQGPIEAMPRWPRRWSHAGTEAFDYRLATPAGKRRVVTLKGGEYFFAPSLPFLKNL